jgi:CubicO group peptidase (beta-lactamase class C family)
VIRGVARRPCVAEGLLERGPKHARLDALWPEGERVETGSLPAGADEAALAKAIDAAFSEPDLVHPRRTRALVVVHGGRIVAERYAEGFHAAMPLIGWSMSKTVANALVGLRVKDGALAVGQNALLPEWRAKDDPRRAVRLDEMLRMTSGLAFNEYPDSETSDIVQMLFVVGDAAAYAAAKPLEAPPATQWIYSSGATNILARALRESFADERDYLRYAQERLFGPLGMRSAVLEPDASGTFVVSSLVYASARDWARFGLLFLRDGFWAGERLLPEGWVAYSLTPTAVSPGGQYGAHIWAGAAA